MDYRVWIIKMDYRIWIINLRDSLKGYANLIECKIRKEKDVRSMNPQKMMLSAVLAEILLCVCVCVHMTTCICICGGVCV